MAADAERPLILLDVDGVLNPTVAGAKVTIDRGRGELVLELERAGSIVWITSWPADVTLQLENAIGLENETRRVPLMAASDGASTPKLRSIARWVERSTDPQTLVVWIDDWLRSDARLWASRQDRRWLLVQPDATTGLTKTHVAEVLTFLN